MDVLDLVRHGPIFYSCDFDGIHASHPLFKDYPQVINAWGMEDAFFQLEIEIMFGSESKDITNGSCMPVDSGTGSNGYIIHVNANRGAKEIVLSYNELEYCMWFIIVWKVAGKLVRPKNMTVGLKSLEHVLKAALCLLPSLIH